MSGSRIVILPIAGQSLVVSGKRVAATASPEMVASPSGDRRKRESLAGPDSGSTQPKAVPPGGAAVADDDDGFPPIKIVMGVVRPVTPRGPQYTSWERLFEQVANNRNAHLGPDGVLYANIQTSEHFDRGAAETLFARLGKDQQLVITLDNPQKGPLEAHGD